MGLLSQKLGLPSEEKELVPSLLTKNPSEIVEPYLSNLKNKTALDSVLSQETQTEIVNKVLKKVPDIIDFIDNFQRGEYAVTSAISGQLKNIQQGIAKIKAGEMPESNPLELWKQTFKDAIKGAKREEKFTARDLLKQASPGFVKYVDDKTTVHPFGIKSIDPSLLTPATFAADVLLDPLTYVPFGLAPKILKGTLSELGKASEQIAIKTLGAASVDAIKQTSSKALDKVYYHTDLKKFVNNVQKRLSKTSLALPIEEEAAGEALEAFKAASSSAKPMAVKTAKELSKVKSNSKWAGILGTFSKQANETEAKQIGSILLQADSDARRVLDNSIADQLGIDVNELSNLYKLDDLIKDVDGAVDLTSRNESIKNLDKWLNVNRNVSSERITGALLEGKSAWGLTKEMTAFESKTTQALRQHIFAEKKAIKTTAIRLIDAELDTTKKALKSETKVLGKMFRNDVGQSLKELKNINSLTKQFVSGELKGDVVENLKSGLEKLHGRIGFLQKYQSAESSLLGKIIKGNKSAPVSTRLNNLTRLTNQLSQTIERSTLMSVNEIKSEILGEIKIGIKNVNSELKGFYKEAGSVIGKIKEGSKVSQYLQRDIVEQFSKRTKELLKDRSVLVAELAKDKVQYHVGAKQLNQYAKVRAAKLYRAFRSLTMGEPYNMAMATAKNEVDNVWSKALKELPEELRDPAIKMRGILDSKKSELKELGLLEQGNPLYFPRDIIDEVDDYFTKQASHKRGIGSGMLKKREFKYIEDTKESILKHNLEVEKTGQGIKKKLIDDSTAIIADYLYRTDMKVAKTRLENSLNKIFKVETRDKLPPQIRAVLKGLFDEAPSTGNHLLNSLFGALKTVNTASKYLLTAANPQFYVRNILGFNLHAATTAGLKSTFHPANFYNNYVDSVLLMAGDAGETWAKRLGREASFKFKDASGKLRSIPFKEIRQAMDKSGYWAGSFLRGDVLRDSKRVFKRQNTFMNFMNGVFESSAKVEDFGRTAALLSNIRSGKNIDEAIKGAMKGMFDYNLMLNPFDKAMQGITGFYTFNRKNLPMQIATMLNDPKQYSIMSKVVNKISNYESLTEEEKEALSNYEKSSLKIFGDAIDGIRHFRQLGFVPLENAYQIGSSLLGGDLGQAGRFTVAQMSPIARTFLEIYSEKSTLYGTEFGNKLPKQFNALPNVVIKALGLTKNAGPKYQAGKIVGEEEFLTGDSKIVAALRSLPLRPLDTLMKAKTKEDVMGIITGFEEKTLDVEQQKFFKGLNIQKKLEEEGKARGLKEGKYIYNPKTVKERKKKRRLI